MSNRIVRTISSAGVRIDKMSGHQMIRQEQESVGARVLRNAEDDHLVRDGCCCSDEATERMTEQMHRTRAEHGAAQRRSVGRQARE